jgi:fluoride exporter
MASSSFRVTKESFRVPEPVAANAASDFAGVGQPPGSAGPPPPGRSRLTMPRADRRTVGAIFAGGAIGTLARAALEEAFPHSATAWPWPTFGVNVVAAFLLGYFVTRLQERLPLSSYRRPLLGTGVCGGLSTFSTMEVEILKMLSAHAYGLAAGYAAASIAAGYAAIHLATALVRRVPVRR